MLCLSFYYFQEKPGMQNIYIFLIWFVSNVGSKNIFFPTICRDEPGNLYTQDHVQNIFLRYIGLCVIRTVFFSLSTSNVTIGYVQWRKKKKYIHQEIQYIVYILCTYFVICNLDSESDFDLVSMFFSEYYIAILVSYNILILNENKYIHSQFSNYVVKKSIKTHFLNRI